MLKKFVSELPPTLKKFATVLLLTSFVLGAAGGAIFGALGAVFVLRHEPGFSSVFGSNKLSSSLTVPSNDPVVAVVHQAAPAVVSIVITKDVPKIQADNSPFTDPFGNDFFNFFGLPGGNQQPTTPPQTQRQEVGGGTGFFVSSDGLILTNKHVVSDESAQYTVLLNSGKKLDARVLARDPSNDLAIVKVDGTGYPTIPLGDSTAVSLGQSVIAIGNALGEFRNTVSTGVVSGLARSVTAGGLDFSAEQLTNVIQTDAAINPGNSGGPLLNFSGQVIGINTAVAQGAQNIGFALPINVAKKAIESVKQNGRIVRPFLGVRYVIVTSDLAKNQSLPFDYGALVVRGQTSTDVAVTPGGPADKAGIVENDIILEVNGQKITEDAPLENLISTHNVGETIQLTISHRGQTKTLSVKLVERK